MRRVLLPLLCLLAAAPAVLAAQTVRGTFTDPATQLGIGGVRVVAVDDAGRGLAGDITDEDGGFQIRLPAAARVRLRADRIGHQSTTSAPVQVAVGETVRLRLVANAAPVTMEALVATGESRRCRLRPGGEDATAVLWEEVRKALEVTRTALAERTYRYQVDRWERDLDPVSRRVVQEVSRRTEARSVRPFRAPSVDSLLSLGFVQSFGDTTVYSAPDPDVLLSEAFLDGHCFRMEGEDDQERVGLAFEPVQGGEVPDVRGTLWLRRQPLELLSLEFEYTRAPLRATRGIPGGTLEFRRLPNGMWIVERWQIRMPVRPPEAAGLALAPRIVRERHGVREEGGEVNAIFTAAGRPVETRPGATLTGVVWDSTAAAPLAGARVVLEGTLRTATTDSAGRYVFRGVHEGAYTLGFRGARLDSLGYVPPTVPLTLAKEATVVRDLAVPPLARVLLARCDAKPGPGQATLAGYVRGQGMVFPAGARVEATWTAPDGTRAGEATVADPTGRYHFCAVPAGVPVTVRVAARRRRWR